MARFTTFVVTLVAFLSLFRAYTYFKSVAAPIPPGVYLGDLALSDLKEKSEIRQHLESRYYETIAVRFADTQLPLRPEDVDFHLDVDQMVAEAGRYLEGEAFVDIALRAALGFPQQRRDVPVRFIVNQEKLRRWLLEVAATYNRDPLGARLLPPKSALSKDNSLVEGLPAVEVTSDERTWTWIPGEPGYQLDLEASIRRVVGALTASSERMADLALIETPPTLPNMADLGAALDSYLADFPGFAAVAVVDLQQGDEANVDADVAFSGVGPIKLGIVAAVLRQSHTLSPTINASQPISRLIDLALLENDNTETNELLRLLGNGDATRGAQQVTSFVQRLGLTNTYMQTPFDAAPQRPLSTAANQRTDWNTNPDPNVQTTPQDSARLLAAIYQCSAGEGTLLTSRPPLLTPDQCHQILVSMTNNPLQDLIQGGLPNPRERWIVHKHGIAAEVHSDVALIWGPAGPYVLAISLYRTNWLDWETSNNTMQAISRLTWQFFELQRAQAGKAPGSPPVLVR